MSCYGSLQPSRLLPLRNSLKASVVLLLAGIDDWTCKPSWTGRRKQPEHKGKHLGAISLPMCVCVCVCVCVKPCSETPL